MVLLRMLVSAPHAFVGQSSTTSPSPQPQLLVSHLQRSSRLHGELNCLADGKGDHHHLKLESSLLPRFETKLSQDSCSRSFSRESHVARVRCMSTAASSREVSIRFPVVLEDNTTVDSTAQAAVEQIKVDGPLVLSLLAKRFEAVGSSDTVELSLRLCNDLFLQDLNSKRQGKMANSNGSSSSPTGVLYFPKVQEASRATHLLLGDVIISLDTAAKQAAEKGHTLLDELRVLLVSGLLRVLPGSEGSKDIKAKEAQILNELGWKGRGLIAEALDGSAKAVSKSVSVAETVKKRSAKPPFKILFCDMDGTLLNEKAKVSDATADALREAMARGVKVIIATGKTQYGAMAALKPVGLTGDGGVISYTSPGVFLQGLQVYGKGGSVIYSSILDPIVVKEAFAYSLEHGHPAVGFCANRSVALFKSSLTEVLHTVYVEAEAEIIPSVDILMETCLVQKLLFYDTPEAIKNKVRPYWASKYTGKVTLVQALDDMLEMLPPGQSKGAGVSMLLDHLGVPLEEVMAIGDGENDIEMLALAGWGVAMENGSDVTKAVANALTGSNAEDGAAQAIHKYILS